MTQIIIKDGRTGDTAKVSESNRLYTDSIILEKANYYSFQGQTYNINTGKFTLTSANKSAVMYVKYTGTRKLVITGLFYLIGNSTGGSGDTLISVLRNPTTGTIIDNASVCEMNGINRNFSSANTLSADMYKGAEGYTFTDGTKVIESVINQSAQRVFINAGEIILEKGNTIGIDYTPATGNTSVGVEFALATYEEDSEV